MQGYLNLSPQNTSSQEDRLFRFLLGTSIFNYFYHYSCFDTASVWASLPQKIAIMAIPLLTVVVFLLQSVKDNFYWC